MKKIILFALLFLTLSGEAQNFNTTIKLGSGVMGNNFNTIETLDGGYLSFSQLMTQKAFLIKTNNFGDTTWTKVFANTEYLNPSIIQIADSSYFITAANTLAAAGAIDIIRISKDGSSIIQANEYSFSGLFGTPGFSEVKTVLNANGDLVTVAHQNNAENIILLITDILGNILNQRSISTVFPNTPAPSSMILSGLSVSLLSNGNVIIGGVSNTDINDYLYLFEVDQTGNMVWQKLIQTNTSTITNYSLHNIKEMFNGNLLIAGTGTVNTNEGTVLMNLDATGNIIFAKHINDNAKSAKVTTDGAGTIYLSAGSNNTSDNLFRIGLYKFTSVGNLITNSVYGLGTSAFGIKISNIFISGNTFKAFAQVSYFGDFLNLFTTDNNFNGGACQDAAVSLTINSFTPSLITWSPSYQPITGFVMGAFPSFSSGYFVVDSIGLSSQGTVLNPLCNGDLGEINYIVSGGTTPYVYNWSNGTNSQNLVNAPGGLHSVHVADAQGCVELDTFSIVEPSALFATFLKTDVTCFSAFDGSINLTVGGGTPGYSFFWANGAQTEDISTLGGGFYQVTITDANGCQLTQGISVAEPGPLTASIIGFQDVSCFGLCDGVLTGNASGGTAPYAYLWNDPFNQTSSSADSLCTGNYLLTLTDANGCNAYTSAYVGQPAPLQNSIAMTNASCGVADGGAIVSTTGGVQPYTYVWSNGNSGNSNVNLDAGNYYIMSYDANGCGDSAIFQISVDVYSALVCEITVDSTSTKNKVIWEKPIVANLAGFNIYRDVVGLYQLIDFVPYDSLSEYTDASNGIDPSTTSYRYKISAVDTCGNEGGRSAFHETIHLTSNLGLNSEVNLIWDGYKGFQVGYYRIIVDSSNNNIQDYYVKDSVSYSNFTWTDNTPPTGDYLVYAIEVVIPSTCTASKAVDHNTTRSNRATVTAPNSLAIEEAVLQQAKVYPNPTVGQVTIELNAPNWSYQIMDMGGKQVQSGVSEAFNTVLDISYLESGIYMIKIGIGSSSIYKKIIKQ